MGIEVKRIEDGFSATLQAEDGAELELQLVEEHGGTYELMVARGIHAQLTDLVPADVTKVAEGLVALAEAAQRHAVVGKINRNR